MPDRRVALRSPTDFLEEDYQVLRDLLARYEQLGSGEIEKKRVFLARIREEYGFHARIERTLFYPAIARVKEPDIRDRICVAEAEHELAEALLAASSRVKIREASFAETLRLLFSHLERLAEQDQQYVFPLARKLPPRVLDDLFQEMEKFRRRLELGLAR